MKHTLSSFFKLSTIALFLVGMPSHIRAQSTPATAQTPSANPPLHDYTGAKPQTQPTADATGTGRHDATGSGRANESHGEARADAQSANQNVNPAKPFTGAPPAPTAFQQQATAAAKFVGDHQPAKNSNGTTPTAGPDAWKSSGTAHAQYMDIMRLGAPKDPTQRAEYNKALNAELTQWNADRTQAWNADAAKRNSPEFKQATQKLDEASKNLREATDLLNTRGTFEAAIPGWLGGHELQAAGDAKAQTAREAYFKAFQNYGTVMNKAGFQASTLDSLRMQATTNFGTTMGADNRTAALSTKATVEIGELGLARDALTVAGGTLLAIQSPSLQGKGVAAGAATGAASDIAHNSIAGVANAANESGFANKVGSYFEGAGKNYEREVVSGSQKGAAAGLLLTTVPAAVAVGGGVVLTGLSAKSTYDQFKNSSSDNLKPLTEVSTEMKAAHSRVEGQLNAATDGIKKYELTQQLKNIESNQKVIDHMLSTQTASNTEGKWQAALSAAETVVGAAGTAAGAKSVLGGRAPTSATPKIPAAPTAETVKLGGSHESHGGEFRYGAYDPATGNIALGKGGHADGAADGGMKNVSSATHGGITTFEKNGQVYWANDSISLTRAMTKAEISNTQKALEAKFPNQPIIQVLGISKVTDPGAKTILSDRAPVSQDNSPATSADTRWNAFKPADRTVDNLPPEISGRRPTGPDRVVDNRASVTEPQARMDLTIKSMSGTEAEAALNAPGTVKLNGDFSGPRTGEPTLYFKPGGSGGIFETKGAVQPGGGPLSDVATRKTFDGTGSQIMSNGRGEIAKLDGYRSDGQIETWGLTNPDRFTTNPKYSNLYYSRVKIPDPASATITPFSDSTHVPLSQAAPNSIVQWKNSANSNPAEVNQGILKGYSNGPDGSKLIVQSPTHPGEFFSVPTNRVTQGPTLANPSEKVSVMQYSNSVATTPAKQLEIPLTFSEGGRTIKGTFAGYDKTDPNYMFVFEDTSQGHFDSAARAKGLGLNVHRVRVSSN